MNVDSWFREPFTWHQIISWILLCASLVPLILGITTLRKHGKSVEKREGENHLIAFEKTTHLVTTGIYNLIRHPLYSSLLLLAWGIFFKIPSWLGGILLFLATTSLFMTARADEKECIRFFGDAYREYMHHTKRFIPWLF
jgi:protein-S-isoprenylcysteine O-methyltransferase Ste14